MTKKATPNQLIIRILMHKQTQIYRTDKMSAILVQLIFNRSFICHTNVMLAKFFFCYFETFILVTLFKIYFADFVFHWNKIHNEIFYIRKILRFTFFSEFLSLWVRMKMSCSLRDATKTISASNLTRSGDINQQIEIQWDVRKSISWCCVFASPFFYNGRS